MPAIKIPKKVTQGEELVVLPRKEYDALRRAARRPVRAATKKPSRLDPGLTEALEEWRRGNVVGPFETVEELRRSLES